jgi:outer membrane protein TolC
MVTHMGYPMLGLGVNYSVINKNEMSTSSMNGKDMIMPMATLTLPIYRNKYNAMKSEAELLKTANKQNYQSTSNSLQSDYYEAVQLFKDGERRMILYDKQSNLAEKTLDIMLKGFSTSGTPLTDILRIRQQTLDYELKKIEAVADYNTAIAWLQSLMAYSPVL